MYTNRTRKDMLLADSIERSVCVRYTPQDDDERRQEHVELTGVDSRLLTILKDFKQRSCIVVAFSPDDADNAPLVKEYDVPTLLRSAYRETDRLNEVRFTVIPGSVVDTDKGTARDKHNKLYQCIDMKNVLIDYVLSSGTIGASSNAKVFLPSGMIRLS